MKTSSAKAKGRRLQQWTRDYILALVPSLHPDDCKSTGMGQGGEDVQLSPAARKHFPISIECKNKRQHAAYNFYQQAKDNAPKDMEPVVIIKQDRHEPLAIVDARHYLELIKKS